MLADTLVAMGSPLLDKELITYLLIRLGSAYELFITFVTTRTDLVISNELYHFLLIHESQINHSSRSTNLNPPIEPSVNINSNSQQD